MADNPFKLKVSDDYHYFDLGVITSELKYDENTIVKAMTIYNTENIKIHKAQTYYDAHSKYKHMCISFHATVPVKTKLYTVRYTMNADTITNCSCNCPECINQRSYYGYVPNYAKTLCPPRAAALLRIGDMLNQHNIGDSTNYDAQMLMNALSSVFEPAPTGEKYSLILVPHIDDYIDIIALTLKFNLGKRAYIIREPGSFVNSVLTGDSVTFGKNTVVDFRRNSLDKPSMELVRLIRKWQTEDAIYYNRDNRWGTKKTSSDISYSHGIPLIGGRIDELFNIAQSLPCMIDKISLNVEEKMPELIFTLNKQLKNRKFDGVMLTGNIPYDFFDSGTYLYYLNENTFCRIPPESASIMRFFISATPKYMGDKFELIVGRRMLTEFYTNTLPQIRKFAEILEPDKQTIDKYISPPAKFTFYLDRDSDTFICRPAVKYGEAEFNPYESLNADLLNETIRNLNAEKQTMEIVSRLFSGNDDKNRLFYTTNPDEAYTLLDTGVDTLMKLGEIQCTQAFQSMGIRHTPPIKMGVSVESNLMELDVISTELSPAELLEIIGSYRKKKKYHRLKNGDFINIDETIEELSMMLEAMHISPKEFVSGKMHIPAYRALYLDKMLEECESLYAHRDSHYKALVKSFKTVRDSDFEVPATLQQTVRNYQNYGYKWLRTLAESGFGGILADDMGLGKTLQMISAILGAKENGETGTSLIICPASLIYNWQEEITKFAPSMTVQIIVGLPEERKKRIESYENYDILITSYDLIKRDANNYEGKQFLFEVLDEAQFIKNHNTAASKSVKIIQAKHRFALTGTPIENRLSELWSIFDFLMPGFLYGYDTFKKELETPIAKKNDEDAKKRLRRMTKPFILRRLKTEVLKDLPDKMEEVCFSKFDEKQRNIYDGAVVRLKEKLEKQSEEGFQKGKLEILAELTRLRQICCDPSLVFEDYHGESAKLDTCMELIHRAIDGEHRILLFSQFTSMLELIENKLNEENIPFYKIIGSTPKEKRVELVHDFNEGNVPVFLISLKAGGTGLNLTGADVVIHYDPWWNVAAQNQATDRAHRIGQTKVVNVYKLIAKNTIEEKIAELQKKKADLADAVLNGESVSISNMSKDDLMAILG